MLYNIDTTKIEIYHEGKNRRRYIAQLCYDKKHDHYVLEYDLKYLHSRTAIPLGPELPLNRPIHNSKKGELFPSFLDRIPDRLNPAYEDYCHSQGISVDESNPIILLATIGRRGPSTFVFEPVFIEEDVSSELKRFRKLLNLSQRDVALFFGMPELTVLRVEGGKCKDHNILQLIRIYLRFPDVALWQLEMTGKYLHKEVRSCLFRKFNSFKSEG